MHADILQLDEVEMERAMLLMESAYSMDLIDGSALELYTEASHEKKKKQEKKKAETSNRFLEAIKKVIASIRKFIMDLKDKLVTRFKKKPDVVKEPDKKAFKDLSTIEKGKALLSKVDVRTKTGRANLAKAGKILVGLCGAYVAYDKVSRVIAERKIAKYNTAVTQDVNDFEAILTRCDNLIQNPPDDLTEEDEASLRLYMRLLNGYIKQLSHIVKHFNWCYENEDIRKGNRDNLDYYKREVEKVNGILPRKSNSEVIGPVPTGTAHQYVDVDKNKKGRKK